jgi:hypothetical protein
MAQSTSTTAFYSETQRFTQGWLLVLVAAIVLFMLYAVFFQLILGEQLGSDPAPDWMLLILGLVFGVGLPLWFFWLRLVIVVDTDGLYYRFHGLHLRQHKIAWSDIRHFYPREYKPLREYGGWGIRIGLHGRAYNVKGNRGVQLVLTDGRKILFGTQDPERLTAAVESASGRSRSKP